jgi:hypothetical protein
MPYKRTPAEAELDALAAELRTLWRSGDIVGQWLRKHAHKLRLLLYDDWSWATLADALTRAGITYRTGHAGTADGLRRDVRRASRPLKRQLNADGANHTQAAASAPSHTWDAKPHFTATNLKSAPLQDGAARTLVEVPAGPSLPKFKAFSLKPQEPPRQLTPAEQEEREVIRKRFS